MLAAEDWTELFRGSRDPSDMVGRLQAKFVEWTDACFPFITYRRRSDKDPWITNAIRKKIRIRLRVFLREGRSQKWKRIDKEVKRMI